MPRIQTVSGSENLPEAHTKVYCYHVPNRPLMSEEHLSRVSKSHPKLVKAHSTPTYVEALAKITGKDSGKWAKQEFDVADGEIIKIFASQDKGFGVPKCVASQYIRAREGAAMWRVRVKLLDRVETNVPYVDVIGRFDLLNEDDLKGLGILINPMFKQQLLDTQHNRIFDKEQLEEAIQAPTIAASRIIEVAGLQTTISLHEDRRVMKF